MAAMMPDPEDMTFIQMAQELVVWRAAQHVMNPRYFDDFYDNLGTAKPTIAVVKAALAHYLLGQELRRADIVAKIAKEAGVDLPAEVAQFLATQTKEKPDDHTA